MRIKYRGRDTPLASTNQLLHSADSFVAQPTEEVMNDLGLTREKAEDWQRICAELAQNVRAELATANTRARRRRIIRNDPKP